MATQPTLTEQLEALAAQHGLTCITLSMHTGEPGRDSFYGASAHAGPHCYQATHKCPEAAIGAAITKINAARFQKIVAVPTLSAAA